MTFKFFTFNGISSLGKVIVTSISRSLAPEIGDIMVQIPGVPGAKDFGHKIGVRYIGIDIGIIGRSQEDLEQRKRELAAWLVTKEPKVLTFSDEPGIEYRARITGQTDIDRLFRVGSGRLTFLCADPFRYESQPKTFAADLSNGGSLAVTNPGSFPVRPVIHIKNTAPLPANLCPNPGFETDTSGWTYQNTGNSSGAFGRDTNRKHSGVASGRLTKLNTTADIPRVYFTLTGYTAGKAYPFEAYVFSDVADGLTIYAEEETSDFQYSQVSETMTSGPAGSWNRITGTITPTDSDGTVYVFFEARNVAAYESWIDDVSLLDGAANVIRNPALSLNGETIQYIGEILPGNGLILDFENWTAEIGGTNALPQINGDFFEIPPGLQSIGFAADAGQARIETTIQGRWL